MVAIALRVFGNVSKMQPRRQWKGEGLNFTAVKISDRNNQKWRKFNTGNKHVSNSTTRRRTQEGFAGSDPGIFQKGAEPGALRTEVPPQLGQRDKAPVGEGDLR